MTNIQYNDAQLKDRIHTDAAHLPTPLDILAENTNFIYRALLCSMAKFLSERASEDHPVAVVLNDFRGGFIFAAVLKHFDGEEGMPGFFGLEFKFTQDEIKDCEIFDTSIPAFQWIVNDISFKEWNFRFSENEYMAKLFVLAANDLIDYLKSNADSDEALELKEYFIGSAITKGTDVVVSLIPGSIVKQYIKNNDATEV